MMLTSGNGEDTYAHKFVIALGWGLICVKKCNSKKWEIEEFCRAKPAFKGVQVLTDC